MDARAAVEQADPLDNNNRGFRGNTETNRNVGGGFRDRDRDRVAFGKAAFAAVGNQPEELEQDALFVVTRYERAASLATNHEAFRTQLVERLAHGARTDAEPGCDLRLARQQLTGRPAAVAQALHQEFFDLPVERSIAELYPRPLASGCDTRFGRFPDPWRGDTHLLRPIHELAASQQKATSCHHRIPPVLTRYARSRSGHC